MNLQYIFRLTVALIALLAGVFYYICYTPGLVQRAAPAFIEKHIPEVSLRSLHIGGQSLAYPEVLKLYDIKAQVEWKDEIYHIEIAEFDFLNFQTFIRLQQQALLQFVGLNIERKNFKVVGAALSLTANLDTKGFKNCEIVVSNGEVMIPPYRVTRVQTKIQASEEGFKIPEFQGQAYGGSVKGSVDVTFGKKTSEVVRIEFKDFKSLDLEDVNKALFSQLQGDVNGTLRLTRLDGLIQVFAIMAEMPKEGSMSMALAKKIGSYMTDEESRYKAMAMIDKQGKLDFDSAQIRILNLNPNLAGVTITLENKKEDFRIHETTNVDFARILKKVDWKQ